jgi:hypothetical protein
VKYVVVVLVLIKIGLTVLLRRAYQVEAVFCCHLQAGCSDSSVIHQLLSLVLNYANMFLNAAVQNWRDVFFMGFGRFVFVVRHFYSELVKFEGISFSIVTGHWAQHSGV